MSNPPSSQMDKAAHACYIYGESYVHRWSMGSLLPAYNFLMRIVTTTNTRASVTKKDGDMMRVMTADNTSR